MNSTDVHATWDTRPETPGTPEDVAAIRRINLVAFPAPDEADLVDTLREDSDAWIPELSWVAVDSDGTPVAYALLTRCHVDEQPALALAPCAVLPPYQKQGAGTAVIRAALGAARTAGENLVIVLGHPDFYPRFGFRPASRFGIRAAFEVPDEALMVLTLQAGTGTAVAPGTVRYPAAFGV
jgi:predicted N-acetyltransferase YhbS